ncbi:MAG TPA: FecR domain-containing protein [Gemmatimonadaceae bacterium]|nr:FecR domain-containing protein [Gemmatimonadaceae bacterium]
MSTSTPPMGSDTPAGPPLSDARDLERLFRSHFPSLAEEARIELADAAPSASRVVEGAFRRAWEDRQQISSPQELEVFLHEAVRHGAARERSRRAGLHRFEAHEGVATSGAHAAATPELDLDRSWSHLSHALHFTADSTATAQVADVLRHGAAEHVAQMAKRPSWAVPALIGGVALAIAIAGIWYVDRLGDASAITQALAAGDARTQTSATAQMAIVTLDDGSRVMLAPDSRLVVPKHFGRELRAVKLDGAGSFEIATGKSPAFEIRAGRASIVATGTKLIVRSSAIDSSIVVQVREGSVTVGIVGVKQAHPLTAGQSLVVQSDGSMREPSAAELGEATTWLDHRVTIANRQLRYVAPELKRWYGLDIKVPDLTLLDRTATVDAPLDSVRDAISDVEQTAHVKFQYEGQAMVFRDAAPKTAAKRKGG